MKLKRLLAEAELEKAVLSELVEGTPGKAGQAQW
jgi:hypothetical protein